MEQHPEPADYASGFHTATKDRSPSVSLPWASMIAPIIGLWGVLLIYDLVMGWQTPPGNRDIIRELLPLLGFLPLAIVVMRRPDNDDIELAFKAIRRLTFVMAATAAIGLLLIEVSPGYSAEGVSTTIPAFLAGRILGLGIMIGLTLSGSDILTLYRHHERGRIPWGARLYGVIVAAAVVAGQLLPMRLLEEGATRFTMVVYGITGAAALVAFILSLRSGWIIRLRKKQKWGIVGLAALGFVASVALLIALDDEQSDLNSVLVSIAPGVAALAFVLGVSLLFSYIVIFVTSLFTLPTADAIDRRNSEVSWLASLSRLLNQSLDADDLIGSAISVTRDATLAQSVWIELHEGDAYRLEYGAPNSITPELAQQLMDVTLPGGGSLRNEVISRRTLQVIQRISGVTRNGNEPGQLRSVAGAPLQHGDRLLGTLYIAKGTAHAFDRDDIVVLSALADQIAMAIEHSRLIRRSIDQERFEQEMLIARTLQRQLLPQRMPESPFYDIYAESAPASIVGGDYYDVVFFSDHTLGILIADVSGKGASAALYMGVVKGIVQAISGSCSSPAELLARANVALHGSIDQRSFVTMTCAQIIDSERRLRIARAGHCPTLLIRNGRGEYSRPRGIGLGIARPVLFEQTLEIEDLSFDSGDSVIFMSDGLPETRAANDEELGYEAILEAACTPSALEGGAREIRDAIIGAATTFANGEPSHDDTTLVVLRWR